MAMIEIDRYVVETLMRDLVGHDRKPAAYLVYLHLWTRAAGAGTETVTASYRRIAVDIGLSKSAVQGAVRHLKGRGLLDGFQASPTAVPQYRILRPWGAPGRRGFSPPGARRHGRSDSP